MSTADELEKLHSLQQKGVITAEEFTAQKAKLLAATSATTLTSAGKPIPTNNSERTKKAQKLVEISNGLGWTGIGLFALGIIIGGFLEATINVVTVSSFFLALAGGIIGQIGRGMQGRAI